jgi:hypothetical protein
METIYSILAVLAGILVRLIVPLIVTGFVVYLLRKLDARWQLEAEEERDMLVKNELPCWIEQGLSIEESKQRATLSDQPCWQVHRSSNGYLREDCLDCEVFLDAPIRNPKHSHAHI